MRAKRLKTLTWTGCYDAQWRGLIVPEAFAHPAKFSRALVARIYAHGLAEGWWRAGDLIGDPFGGVALGGIMAAYAGLHWIGVELEERFLKLGEGWDCPGLTKQEWARWHGRGDRNQAICPDCQAARKEAEYEPNSGIIPDVASHRFVGNLDLHRRKFKAMGVPRPVLLRGDSRRFAEIVGVVGAVVTSPPYSETLNHGGGPDTKHDLLQGGKSLLGIKEGYGSSDGQIGGLPTGSIDGVLTSPPYIASISGRGDGIDWERTCATHRGTRSAGRGSIADGYGEASGQIGALQAGTVDGVVTSPPWEDQESSMSAKKFKDPFAFALGMTNRNGSGGRNGTTQASREAQFNRATQATYGRSDGQIGNVVGETYWQAMAQVYGQCLVALRPGGVMAVVVKDYVKAKRRVPLCDQTLELLTRLGFAPVVRIRALLTKTTTEPALVGPDIVTLRERKSFFRRLAEKKGSPRIDWEEVVVVRKAEVSA